MLLFKQHPSLHDYKKIKGDQHLVEITRNIVYQLQLTRIESINTSHLHNYLSSILDKDNIIIILNQSTEDNLYLFFENIWISIHYLPKNLQIQHLNALKFHLESFKYVKFNHNIDKYITSTTKFVKNQKLIPYITIIIAIIICWLIYYFSI